MLKFFGAIIDRIFAVMGALLFAQFPAFTLQYTHQLAGRVAELKKQIQLLEEKAFELHLTLPEYISRFSVSTDPVHVTQGDFLSHLLERYTDLQYALSSLLQASTFSRPLVFFQHFDWEQVTATATHFTPVLAFSLEGILFGFFGLLVGHLLYRTTLFLVRPALRFSRRSEA